MPNPFGAPEISVQAVARRRAEGEEFLLVDVREQEELDVAVIEDALHLPLSELRERQEEGIPAAMRDQEVDCVIFCHKGVRSARVTAWLMERGWTGIKSMDGGIDAWSREIDDSVNTY